MTVIQTIVDSGLLVLIWLVQLIIYPSFRYTEKKEFNLWHTRYTGLISLIFVPLMLLQVGGEAVHIIKDEYRWVRILMVLAVLIFTISLSVPCHRRLQREGKNPLIINRLVLTNWLRTIIWSLLFIETVFGLLLNAA